MKSVLRINTFVFLIIATMVIIFLWKRSCRRRVISMVMKMDPSAQSILDLGCGACCNMVHLSQEGKRIVSLDVVDKGICTKPELFDGKTIPYDDKTFDLGICSFVLHHTNTYSQLLQELKRTCTRVLVIENTPEIGLDWFFTRAHARSQWGTCEDCFKNAKGWKEEFKRRGFSVLRMERLSRWVCPFGDHPWIYPVPSTAYLLA